MAHVDFIRQVHQSTKRDYMARVNDAPKAQCASVAKKFGYDYWDGERKFGYGGYRYDGRWRSVAEKIVAHYGLQAGASVLDVGCGKAHLLYELSQVVPGLNVVGIDVSDYALEHAKEEIKPYLSFGEAQDLGKFADHSFDLVISLSTLHNLYLFDLFQSIKEIQRVSKGNSYIVVESYRNEEEKVNLMYWQLTCECFFTVDEWEWIYRQCGYTGDYSFIFFE